jgi:sec-independent protein translocase protein TatA
MLGTTEILLIVLAVTLLFGGKKIPELARGLGSAVSEFREASAGKTKK